jgi:hypothetical protein
MPSWKKVITSGSAASLSSLTTSGNISGSSTSTGSFGLVELSSNSVANASLLKLNYGGIGSTSNHAVLSVNAQGSLRIMSKANNSVFEIGLYNAEQFQFEKYNASGGAGLKVYQSYGASNNFAQIKSKTPTVDVSAFAVNGYYNGNSGLGGDLGNGSTGTVALIGKHVYLNNRGTAGATEGKVGAGILPVSASARLQVSATENYLTSSALFKATIGDNTTGLTDVFTVTGDNKISGSSTSTGSFAKLKLTSNITGSDVFTVDGLNGRLFTVTDEMSGSIFSANLISGLPVIEAFSDNRVNLGPFSSPIQIDSSGNISGSSTSTGSFGHSTIDSSLLVGRKTPRHANTLLGLEGTTGDNGEVYLDFDNTHASGLTRFRFLRNGTEKANITYDSGESDFFIRNRVNNDNADIIIGLKDGLTINTFKGDGTFIPAGDVSGSSVSTGSFGKLLGDGSDLTGVSSDVVDDTTPQLGGNLDLNSNDITGTGNIDIQGNITAQNFIVSSSVTSITYQSLSGSTIFGDTSDDTHEFIGNTISGSSTSTGSFGHVQIGPKIDDGNDKILQIGNRTTIKDVRIGATGYATQFVDSSNSATMTIRFGKVGIGTDLTNLSSKFVVAGDDEEILLRTTNLNRSSFIRFEEATDHQGGFIENRGNGNIVRLGWAHPSYNSGNDVEIITYPYGVTERQLNISASVDISSHITGSGNLEIAGNISGSSTSTGSFGQLRIVDDIVSTDTVLNYISDNYHVFYDADDLSTPAVSIVGNNKRLGIGVLNPGNALEVVSGGKTIGMNDDKINFSVGMVLEATNNVWIDFDNANSSTARTFKITHNDRAETLFQIDESGDVEIPVGNISGSSTSTGSFGKLEVGSQIRFIEGADSFINGGDFGIGTNTPVARLEIADNSTTNAMLLKLTQDNTSVYGMVIGNATFSTTATDGGQHILGDDGTYIIRTIGSSTSARIGAGTAWNDYKYLEIDYDSDTAEFTTTKISGSAVSTGSFGNIQVAQDFLPTTDNNSDLGAADKRWANIYSADLQLSNEGTEGNEVDGTTGNWTIQEGKDDLYLLNRKNGKKYKFKLEEVT